MILFSLSVVGMKNILNPFPIIVVGVRAQNEPNNKANNEFARGTSMCKHIMLHFSCKLQNVCYDFILSVGRSKSTLIQFPASRNL